MTGHPGAQLAGIIAVGLMTLSSGVAAVIHDTALASIVGSIAAAIAAMFAAWISRRNGRAGDVHAEQLARIEAAVERLDARAHEMGERVARVEGALFPQHTRSGDNQ